MIILKHRQTEQLIRWPENEPYSGVKWEAVDSTMMSEIATLEAELEKNGVKWGDAVAWVTKRIGVTQCAPCRARQEILNNLQQLGLIETIRQIKETF